MEFRPLEEDLVPFAMYSIPKQHRLHFLFNGHYVYGTENVAIPLRLRLILELQETQLHAKAERDERHAGRRDQGYIAWK
jgi:hypothetical protein